MGFGGLIVLLTAIILAVLWTLLLVYFINSDYYLILVGLITILQGAWFVSLGVSLL